MNLTVPHGRWRRGNRQQLEAWDLPFLCLSLQQNFLLLYGYSGRIVQYFSFREHIASSVGTEELAHLEMVCTIVHQLTRGLSAEEIAAAGLDKYYVDHTLAL
ncbi:MAG: manganese catalase family protein, partial [Lachnospiraceae bacterium]|nr:manganese catalase family protein [Lachnospiraceae bacterium]